MAEPFETKSLAGWGRMQPRECHVYRPERSRDLSSILGGHEGVDCIARGLGRSYGDAAVNETGAVIDTTRLNRMLDFNPEEGLLDCEGGVSLPEIIEAFLPRGFFLPVTPGTKFVTVGGAIANDVHGKNHHADGTFGKFVEEIELLTGAGENLRCSPSENADVFWATVGGIGLTGLILRARFRLQPVETAFMSVDYHQSADLDDVLATMAASDAHYQYSVAWVDCLARGKNLGRSVLMRANHAAPDQLPSAQRKAPLALKPPRTKSIPIDFPGFVLNPLAIKMFNELFYRRHRSEPGVLVYHDAYFYPLDRIHHWNRMYGKQGFVQYQATLPPQEEAGLVKLLERLSASRRASFLAVLKTLGAANPGMLSHPMKGFTLTLDIPNRAGLIPFLHELDRILLDHGGRLYLAKDMAAEPETIRAMYPRLDEFRAVKERLDPGGRLSSSMARRLEIVPPRTQKGAAHG